MFLDSIDASRGFGFGRYAVDSIWTREPAGVMSLLADRLAASPSQYSHAVIQFKVRTELPPDAALSRIAPAFAGVYSVWRDEAIDSAAQRWLRETMTPLEQYADGHYINEIDAEARPQRIEASFSNSAWRRLAELRRARDPGAVFHDFFGRDERGLGAST
jgi:FAD/FMN-containing dehydrogenase